LEKTTSVEHPFFHYDPITAQIYDQIEASHNDDGKRSTIIVLGVDILPTELAKESSQHFGNALLPLLKCIHMTNKNELCMPLELERACITEGGNLKPRYNYLSSFIHKYRKQEMTISSTDRHQYSILLSLEVRHHSWLKVMNIC
jgi:alpha-aminoadipic semialdehyde synthase